MWSFYYFCQPRTSRAKFRVIAFLFRPLRSQIQLHLTSSEKFGCALRKYLMNCLSWSLFGLLPLLLAHLFIFICIIFKAILAFPTQPLACFIETVVCDRYNCRRPRTSRANFRFIVFLCVTSFISSSGIITYWSVLLWHLPNRKFLPLAWYLELCVCHELAFCGSCVSLPQDCALIRRVPYKPMTRLSR